MKLGMKVQAFNPSTQEIKAEEPEVQSHPQVWNEFEASLKYLGPCPLQAPQKKNEKSLQFMARCAKAFLLPHFLEDEGRAGEM